MTGWVAKLLQALLAEPCITRIDIQELNEPGILRIKVHGTTKGKDGMLYSYENRRAVDQRELEAARNPDALLVAHLQSLLDDARGYR